RAGSADATHQARRRSEAEHGMTATETPSGHKTFHEKLDLLKQRLLDMSQLAEDLLAKSVQAFLRRDALLAGTVLPADAEVDLLEVEIEQLAISLLALQQPMARDL